MIHTYNWNTHELKNAKGGPEIVIYTKCKDSPPNGSICQKIAAFDIDWCLVRPKSNKKHPQNSNDWKWLYERIPSHLIDLHSRGFGLVFFSNQKLAGRSPKHLEMCKKRMAGILDSLNCPNCSIFCSITGNLYRKPSVRLWNLCETIFYQNVKIDRSLSIFVGDAAGRNGDFACSDRQFAFNVGCDFKTPEEFFLGTNPLPFRWMSYEPILNGDSREIFTSVEAGEILIIVGYPCSGKSRLARKISERNVVSVVDFRPQNTEIEVEDFLGKGCSVVVDGFYNSAEKRRIFLSYHRGRSVRCIVMDATRGLAEHLSAVRHFRSDGGDDLVAALVFDEFGWEFESPTTDEGFLSVERHEFVYDEEEDEMELFGHFYTL